MWSIGWEGLREEEGLELERWGHLRAGAGAATGPLAGWLEGVLTTDEGKTWQSWRGITQAFGGVESRSFRVC